MWSTDIGITLRLHHRLNYGQKYVPLETDMEIGEFGTPDLFDWTEMNELRASQQAEVCLFINDRCCKAKSVIIPERMCTPDIERLSVLLRPPNLPREFPQTLMTLVYIHPRVNESSACEQKH